MASTSAFPGLFQKEKAGLELIAEYDVIKTPLVIDCFEQDDTQILLLEWVEPGERTEVFLENLWRTVSITSQLQRNPFWFRR